MRAFYRKAAAMFIMILRSGCQMINDYKNTASFWSI